MRSASHKPYHPIFTDDRNEIPPTRGKWPENPDFAFTAKDRSEIARILPVGWAYGNHCGPEQTASVEHCC